MAWIGNWLMLVEVTFSRKHGRESWRGWRCTSFCIIFYPVGRFHHCCWNQVSSIHSPFLPGHESPESQLESCSLKARQHFSLLVPGVHLIKVWPVNILGLPSDSVVKNLPASEGDVGSPGSGRSAGRGNGNPVQYACLENPMDRGAWQATVHGVARVGHDLLVTKPSSMVA